MSGRLGRIRPIDGLIVAAVALLGLKGLGLILPASGPQMGPDGLPPFARVLAHARTNYVPIDPTTTGSVGAATPAQQAKTPEAVAPAGGAATRKQPEASAEPATERVLRERLSDRREELRGRSQELDARQRIVEELEKRLEARETELKSAEERRAETTAAAEPSDGGVPKGMVVMYETMKPKEAARIFERLPHDVLVPVVRRINPRKMAEILAAMSPETAEKLTVALARRDRPAEERQASGTLPPGELPAIEPERRAPPARRAASRPGL